jgi:hypothetical protein
MHHHFPFSSNPEDEGAAIETRADVMATNSRETRRRMFRGPSRKR